jgi:hypothetical protein
MAKKRVSLLREEKGAAIVIALIMMIVLTLIGLASTYTSTYEMKLSGNKRGSTNAFYVSDGGAQSVVALLSNFDKSHYSAVASTALPVDLRNESIDTRFSSPVFSLPAGVSFNVPPTVTMYHTTRTSAPRGLGFSATGGIDYEHFFIDSVGSDQVEVALSKATSEIREKVVRLLPTSQGGL